jgi:hypothetical protein
MTLAFCTHLLVQEQEKRFCIQMSQYYSDCRFIGFLLRFCIVIMTCIFFTHTLTPTVASITAFQRKANKPIKLFCIRLDQSCAFRDVVNSSNQNFFNFIAIV